MTKPKPPHHDDLAIASREICIQQGFALVFSDLVTAKHGERPDELALCERDNPLSGWANADGTEDQPLYYGDSLVIERKATRSDFLKDAEKPHRSQPPRYGDFFAYLAPEGVIRPSDLQYGQGLYLLNLETKAWRMVERPLRRRGIDKNYELILLARALSQQSYRAAQPQASGKVSKIGPKAPRKGHGGSRTDKVVALAQRVLDEAPGVSASQIKELALELFGESIDMSPVKLAEFLRKHGVPFDRTGGKWMFYSSNAKAGKAGES